MDQLAISERFPHFKSLFSYNQDGYINGINKGFTWQGHDCFTIKNYIVELASHVERDNLKKFTNVTEFILRIQSPRVNCFAP
jgi:hypothetical protein